MSSYSDRIKPDHTGISTYLENLLGKKYQIPTFQRDVVWDKENVKKLWDSIYKFYPLGSILVWKTKTKLQNHREIGGIELPDDYDVTEFQYILDGQQRTTSLLTSLYGGKIVGKKGFDPTLYVDLTIEHKDATDDESYKKRFLFWDEIDDRNGKLIQNTGRQKRYNEGLIVKIEDIRKSFGNIERSLNEAGYTDYDHPYRAELRRLREVLDNYRVSFIELQGIQVAEVCQIFERINQAGKPLNIFDIVVAKTFRPVDEKKSDKGFYLRELFDDYRKSIEKSNYASIDDITILQMLAVIINNEYPESNILNITDRYLNEIKSEHIEGIWNDVQKAMTKVFDFLDNVMNIKGPNLVPYRYFYMTMATYFFKNDAPDYDFLQKYFWFYSFHNEDLLSNTTQLKSHVDLLKEQKSNPSISLGNFLIDKNRLRESSYSSKGRLSRGILALLASHIPKDWATPHRPVLTDVYYVLTDKPNLHHIFPMNFVEKSSLSNTVHANSLMNIAYLTQITNLKISDNDPLDYLIDYDVDGFEDVLNTHLVPSEILEWTRSGNMPADALNIFINKRVDTLIEVLKGKLGGMQFNEMDSLTAQGVVD